MDCANNPNFTVDYNSTSLSKSLRIHDAKKRLNRNLNLFKSRGNISDQALSIFFYGSFVDKSINCFRWNYKLDCNKIDQGHEILTSIVKKELE